MIVLDSDVTIDILRGLTPAVGWFDQLPDDQILINPGYVALELIWGTKDTKDQRTTENWLADCKIVWLEPEVYEQAYRLLVSLHLKNAIGVFDVLIAQVAISLDVPLHTFNQKHYNAVPGLRTVRPYVR